jgi:hypothetical protein
MQSMTDSPIGQRSPSWELRPGVAELYSPAPIRAERMASRFAFVIATPSKV